MRMAVQERIKKVGERIIVIWENSPSKDAGVIKRCPECFNRWRNNGSNEGEKISDYPRDYEGDCLFCGSKLSSSKPPF